MSSADPRPRLRAVPDPADAVIDAERSPVASPQVAAIEPAAATVVPTSAVQFSETVRQVVTLARRQGLRPPVFRSPPRLDGVDRSIRRRPNGTVVVAVRRAGRPLAAIQSDVIDGVVAANALTGSAADKFRHAAWERLAGVPDVGTRTDRRGPRRPTARVA